MVNECVKGETLSEFAELASVARANEGVERAPQIDPLLLVGDLKSYLNLAIEVAPFYRAGRAGDARVLEQALERDLFPRLAAEVGRGYVAIRDLYVGLSDDLSPEALRAWAAAVLDILSRALGQPALLGCRLSVAAGDAP